MKTNAETLRHAEGRGEIHENEISEAVIGAAIEVHRVLGPGLLEAVYEEALCREFIMRNIEFERQKPVPVTYKGATLPVGLRLDLIVAEKVILEIKAKESLAPSDKPQLLSYLRLTERRLGLLINFHMPTLVQGISRVVNHLEDTSAPLGVSAFNQFHAT
jgi:GxxExxY protein